MASCSTLNSHVLILFILLAVYTLLTSATKGHSTDDLPSSVVLPNITMLQKNSDTKVLNEKTSEKTSETKYVFW